MCERAVGLGSVSKKKTFLDINKKKMIMLLFLRNTTKILNSGAIFVVWLTSVQNEFNINQYFIKQKSRKQLLIISNT